MDEKPRKRIGELLQDANVITAEQLRQALVEQRETGELIGKAMLRLNMVDAHILATMLAFQKEVEGVDLDAVKPSPSAVRMLSKEQALDAGCLPLNVVGDVLTIVMADPMDAGKLAGIASITGMSIQLRIAPSTRVYAEIQNCYG